MSIQSSRARLRAAIEADRRRIAAGERPIYQVRGFGPDADIKIVELPIVHLFVPDNLGFLKVRALS
jgi:hypothetical protein